MRSRSRLALAAALLVGGAAVLTADPATGWVKGFGRSWFRQQEELHIFCDGPHRVYVALSEDRATPMGLFVLKEGCLDWPKPAPKPAPTPKPPAEAPLQKGKP